MSDGDGAPRGHDLKQWLFGIDQIATGAALFPLEHYKDDIIIDLFGDLSYFADADAFWVLQNAAIASLKDELAGKGWTVTVLERGAHFQSWQCAEVTLEDGGEAFVEVRSSGEVETHQGYRARQDMRVAADDPEDAKDAAQAHFPGASRCVRFGADVNRRAAVARDGDHERTALAHDPDPMGCVRAKGAAVLQKACPRA